MADSIISSIVGSFVDQASVFSAINEQSGRAVFSGLKIKDVSIDSQSMNTIHPIANQKSAEGRTLQSLTESDIKVIKIIQPSIVRITAYATSLSSLEGAINTFSDSKITISVTTKGIKAVGMVPVNFELTQEPDMMSATELVMTLEQSALPTLPNKFTPGQSSDSSVTSSYGVAAPAIQTTSNLTSSVTNLYNKVSNFIRG